MADENKKDFVVPQLPSKKQSFGDAPGLEDTEEVKETKLGTVVSPKPKVFEEPELAPDDTEPIPVSPTDEEPELEAAAEAELIPLSPSTEVEIEEEPTTLIKEALEGETFRHKKANKFTKMNINELRKIVREKGAADIEELSAGEILLQEGYLTPEELEKYLGIAHESGDEIEEVLRKEKILSELDSMRVLANRCNVDFVDLNHEKIDPLAQRFVDRASANKFNAFPYKVTPDASTDQVKVYIAVTEPNSILIKDVVRGKAEDNGAGKVEFVVATNTSIRENIVQFYKETLDIDASIEEMPEEEVEENLAVAALQAQDEPVVKLVNQIIALAVSEGASDIHCESTESGVMGVRMRVDGLLTLSTKIPKRMHLEVINRLKTMADMDIANKNVPQDGRASRMINGLQIDLRLVSTPTIYGENISIRILDKSTLRLHIDELGFSEHNVEAFTEGFTRPHGSVLVTGPTGSGKTTTLYAALILMDKDQRNIVTIEDPVEYKITGINQCQVNGKKGLSFPLALRGLMRADPDIIMVGEIRDGETARIGTEASLTGHLLLSTLHTNDAASAITRLVEMKVERYALANTLECIVAQRLCRKLCHNCKVEHKPTEEELRANSYPEHIVNNLEKYEFYFAHPEGCGQCGHTGYKGRTAISEVLTVSEKIKLMILEGKSSIEIKKQAIKEGMVPLIDNGFEKVAQGITTVAEMHRVTL